MTADDQLESGWYGRRRGGDDEPGSNARAKAPCRRSSHRRRGFPRGDHAAAASAIGERRVDEAVRRGRSNAGPDNRQEIVSKIRE
jgi:hypothetical protein